MIIIMQTKTIEEKIIELVEKGKELAKIQAILSKFDLKNEEVKKYFPSINIEEDFNDVLQQIEDLITKNYINDDILKQHIKLFNTSTFKLERELLVKLCATLLIKKFTRKKANPNNENYVNECNSLIQAFKP